MERKPRRIAPNDASQSHLSGDALDDLRPITFIPYTPPARTTATRAPLSATTISRTLEAVFNTTAIPIAHANPSRPARFPVAVFHRPYTPSSQQPSQPTPQRTPQPTTQNDDLIVISSDEEDAIDQRPKGKSMQDAINLDEDEGDIDILTVSPSPTTTQQQPSTAITIDDDDDDPQMPIPSAMQERSVTSAAAQTQGQQQDLSTIATLTTTLTPQQFTSSLSTLQHPVYNNNQPSTSAMHFEYRPAQSTTILERDDIVDNIKKDQMSPSANLSTTPTTNSGSPSAQTPDMSMNYESQHKDIKQEEESLLRLKQEKSSDSLVDKMGTTSNQVTAPTTSTSDQYKNDDMDLDQDRSDDDSVASAELFFDSTSPSVSRLDIDLMYALNASEIDNNDQPDWNALAQLSIQDDTDTITNGNGMPTLSELASRPITTAISLKDDMDDEHMILEILSHIDAYDMSLESLSNKANSSSLTQGTSSIRNGSKRRKTNNGGPPTVVSMKPYVPAHVWTHTTWEDWAQLQVGDWLHWPFETWEIQRMERGLDHYNKKKLAVSSIKPEIWQILADQLPGRRPEDCQRYWRDCELGVTQPYGNPVMIGKGKAAQLEELSQFDLVQRSKIKNHFRVSSARRVLWSELNHQDSFGGGSADAIALQVIKTKRHRGDRLKVVVASACNDQPEYNMPGNLRLWSADTKKVTQLPYHRTEIPLSDGTQYMWHTVTDVRVSNDQRFIYSSSHDKSARVWDAKSGKLLSTLVFHEKQIHQLAVSPDRTEHILASGSADGTAVIWRLKAGGNVGSGTVCDMAAKMPNESKDRVSIDTLAFGTGPSAGKLFTGVVTGLTGPEDPAGFIQVYDASNGKDVVRLTSMTTAVCDIDVSSTGKLIASANYGASEGQVGDGYVHIHDIRTPQAAILAKSGHTDVNVVRMSPCERYVASGNPDNETAILDTRKPTEPIFRLRHDRRADTGRLEPLNSDMGIAGIYWMSNTRQLLTGGGDASVKLWDIWGNGEMVRSYSTSSNVTSLAVDEDSMVICAGVAGSQGYVHMFSGAQL